MEGNKSMKVCLVGGHLGPALALLDSIPSDWRVVFIGRKHVFEGDGGLSLEYQTVTKKNIPFYSLTSGRLQRKVTGRTIASLPKIPLGYMQALHILRTQKPDIVVGFGGYLSLAACLAAKTLGIPVFIHEQTLRAGLANRIVGKFAKKICISWETSRRYFPAHKTILTGNLLRKAVVDSVLLFKKPNTAAKNPSLYITGGSSGAHAVNLLVEKTLGKLLETYSIVHQTGDALEFGDYQRLLKKKESLPNERKKRYTIQKFTDPSDIGATYRDADLVISRSGANTMTELLVMKKPCLLIPLPHGQRGEQIENAVFLKEKGLATVLHQEYATSESFISSIDDMVRHLANFTLDVAYNTSFHLHAAERLVAILSAYEKEKNKKS